MRSLVLFALLSVAAARPKPGYLGGWDAHGLSIGHEAPLAIEHAPLIHEAPVIHAPVIHAAPVVHAPVVAKAATSYSSFQRVIHPVQHVVAQPVIHAAPVVHAPVIHSAPILSHNSLSSYGHGW